MPRAMTELIDYLRRAGFSMATSEITDLMQVLPLVGQNQADFLAAAASTLAKDKASYELLEQHLVIFFRELRQKQTLLPPHIDVQAVCHNPPRLTRAEFIQRQENIGNSILREISGLQKKTPTSVGHAGAGGTGAAGRGVAGLATGQIMAAGLVLGQHLNSNNDPPASARPGLTNLWQLDLAVADPEQLQEIQKHLVRLAKKLAVSKGYRKKPASGGVVDMRCTVAKALRYGVPLTLSKQQKITARPKIILLCDLSGSVAPYSVFMLQLLISLQQQLKSCRCFAFVDHVEEVTPMVRCGEHDMAAVTRKILRQAKISKTGFSNYGQVWARFWQRFGMYLHRDVTLIVLGDARNNWQPDGLDYLGAMARRCRQLVWLNPMPRDLWNRDDCIMADYEPVCTKVLECRNARQLARVVRAII